MKVPRDVNASELIIVLRRYGYNFIKQTGSHIRLLKNLDKGEHVITVPNHSPIKIGTLQNIVKDICFVNKLELKDFYRQL